MTDILKLAATEDTPEVYFDVQANEFRLSGRSLPEDAFAFYAPIIKWLETYSQNPSASSVLVISLDYFNSSSVKQLLEIMSVFERLVNVGKDAKIVWCYDTDDDLMEIKGLEFQSMIANVPFELKAC
ncbi:MAG: DUF1987 domain-containing protein [Bacteroidia bacterium]|nr:DUF1987 domain-containing protein [Bacteroidia bacterium]